MADFASSFIGGMQAAQQNAFARTRLQREQQLNALAGNPNATPEQYIRAGDAATGNALANVQQQQQIDKQQAIGQLATIAKQAFQIAQTQGVGASKAFTQQAMQTYGPHFQALGVDVNQSLAQLQQLPDEQYLQGVQRAASLAPPEKPLSVAAGTSLVNPTTYQPLYTAPNPAQEETARHNRAMENLERDKPRGGNFRALTPAEVQAAGLPAGTSAQVDLQTGKIDVLSKRDTSATLSQKDATAARIKLNNVKTARQQLQRIKEAFEEGRKGVNAFGPGQGLLPTQAGKKFDARVDQMRSTLTALTRTPGVGSMSDYETKLDQSKFPNRNDYENVTADKLQGLDDLLSSIESGYTELLSGGTQTPAQTASAAPAAAPSQAANAGPVRVNTPQEAMALPSGTRFVTPDGRVKVRP